MPAYASIGNSGGVSAEIQFATIEGLKILENGKNASDADIAVSSILAILMPHGGSIEGDGFLLAVDAGGELVTCNGSSRSSQGFPVEDLPIDHRHGVSQKILRTYPKTYARIAKMTSEDATAMILYLLVILSLRDVRRRGVPNSSFGIFCFTSENQKTCDGFSSGVSLFFLESVPIFVRAPHT